MELQIYLKILKKNIVLILICSIIVSFLAAIFTLRNAPKYDASISISVSRKSSPEFEGFYAGQASKLFTDTIASWLRSPEIVADIYKEAGLVVPVAQLRKLRNIFDLEGSASQHLKISFSEASEERAEKVVRALPRVVQKNNNALFSENDRFLIVATEPLILERKSSVFLNTVIAFLVSFVFLFFIGLIFEYFKEIVREENGRGV